LAIIQRYISQQELHTPGSCSLGGKGKIIREAISHLLIKDGLEAGNIQVTTLCESHYDELRGMVSSSTSSTLGDLFIFEEVQRRYYRTTEGSGGTFEPELRENQATSFYHLLGGNHFLCVLATNSGKTLIQIVPIVMLTHVKAEEPGEGQAQPSK
jgi:hypothetical protein